MAQQISGDEKRPIYPFTAVVAQNDFKTALILNAIDPGIGGVLLTGPKGTGKSSIVRATAEIFPDIDVVENCVFRCDPFDARHLCEECRLRVAMDEELPKKKEPVRVITLPLSATEDRVIGSLDVEAAISKGVKALQSGILAEANQNILYIDEVNLLPDHLVDMILDVSASGWNIIEREGISVTHPSRFILIGSMNPEEGALRPQILDRFGLHATAQRLLKPENRIAVIRRSEAFLMTPLAFRDKYARQQEEVRRKIEAAKAALPRVQVSQSIMESIARICTHLEVDGYRPDIVMMRAAKAHAAYHDRQMVLPDDLLLISTLALSHRTRQSGQKPPPTTKEIQKAVKRSPVGRELLISKFGFLGKLGQHLPSYEAGRLPLVVLLASLAVILALFFTPFLSVQVFLQFITQIFSSIDQTFMFFLIATLIFVIISLFFKRPSTKASPKVLDLAKITTDQMSGKRTFKVEPQEDQDVIRTPTIAETTEKRKAEVESGEKVFESLPQAKPAEYLKKTQRSQEGKPRRGRRYLVGKRAPVVTSLSRGRYIWHELPKEKPWNVALGPTIRMAAPYQQARKNSPLSVVIKPQDIRIKMKEYRAPFSIVLLVDLSLSMIGSIINLGKAITDLHKNAFRRRDRVGLVVFKGDDAFVLQEPTTNIDLVVRKLWKAGVSDFTPMAIGMLKAWRVLRLEKQRNKDSILMLIIISDGIANVSLKHPLYQRGHEAFLSKAQADSIDVARLLSRDNIRTVVINTSHSPIEAMLGAETRHEQRSLFTPTEFLTKVAESAKGSYYGLVLKKEDAVKIPPEYQRRSFPVSSWLKKRP